MPRLTLARFTSRSPHPTILETIDDLTPDAELAALLGCRMGEAGVEVDEYQQTSVEGVYCAGEATGIGGLDLMRTGKTGGRTDSGFQPSRNSTAPPHTRL
jgi:hypothetical protein